MFGSYKVEDHQLLRDVRVPAMYMGEDDYRLVLWDTYNRDGGAFGRYYLGYALYHRGEVVFEGESYSPSPMDSIDGDESVRGLLGFLSCQPGDTDDEYFESYTEAQLDFVRAHGEALSLASMEADDDHEAVPLLDW